MKTKISLFAFVLPLFAAFASAPADKGVYQWGVEVDGVISKETKKPPRAYLWIPEKCMSLKAVVLANDNMLEEPLFADDGFRASLASVDCGIILVSSGFQGMNEQLDETDRPKVLALLKKLADESGYGELAERTLLVPLGHSAWADWPYFVANAWPERTACGVSLKGSWPHAKGKFFTREFAERMKDVPLLLVSGEYEGDFAGGCRKTRDFLKDKHVDLRIECDWGSGHFEYSPEMASFLGRYIRDAVRAAVSSKPPYQERNAAVSSKPPYQNAIFGGIWPQKSTTPGKFSVLAFKDAAGKEIEQNPKYHLQVTLPDLAVRTAFAEKVPPNRPERWTGLPAGSANPRPESDDAETQIDWFVVQGPGVKTGREGLEVRFNRHGFEGYRAREIVLAAVYPGDGEFRRSVQQAIVRFPLKAREGKVEHPNGFYIREGAARVNERGEITFTPLPPRAKRPAFVTLCAYERNSDGGTIYEFRRMAHP